MLLEPLEARRLLARQVSGVLGADDTWSGTIHVTDNVRVESGVQLTIQAGTVVKFAKAKLLDVNGSLIAEGAPDNQVFFTSDQDDSVGEDLTSGEGNPYAGFWESLYLNDGSGSVTLRHVNVRYGGDTDGDGVGFGAVPSIQLGKEASLLSDVKVTDSYGTGVSVDGGATLNSVNVQNSAAAFTQTLHASPTYQNLSAINNATNAVVVDGGTLTENRSWDFGGLPAHLAGDLTIGQDIDDRPVTLSVAAGTVIKVPRAKLIQSSSGTLSAIGTAAQPIVFTATSDDSVGGDSNGDGHASAPYRGFWEAIYLRGPGNAMEHVEVRYAGDTDGDGAGFGAVNALEIDHVASTPDAESRLAHVNVAESYSTGVGVLRGSPMLEDVHVRDGSGVAFYFALAASPSASGLTAADTGGDRIELQGGTLSTDRSWDYGQLPVQLSGDFAVAAAATLTIAAGTVVKMPQAKYIESTTGTISAIGTAAEPIVFTAATDDSVGGDSNNDGVVSTPYRGFWEAIYLRGPGNAMEHVEVHYAGDTDGDGAGFGGVNALEVNHAAATAEAETRLNSVLVSHSYTTGIGVRAGSPLLQDVHVQDGNGVAFYFALAASPTASARNGGKQSGRSN